MIGSKLDVRGSGIGNYPWTAYRGIAYPGEEEEERTERSKYEVKEERIYRRQGWLGEERGPALQKQRR